MTADAHPLANHATARTLDYALGNLGGRRKSWMVENSFPAPIIPSNAPTIHRAPVPVPVSVQQPKRRGRPPKNPTHPPLSTLHAHAPSMHHVERHPASNPTSPQLPNVMSSQNTAESRPAPYTVFPSPTPSEETIYNIPTPIHRGDNTGRVNLNYYQVDPMHTVYPPNMPLETIFMDSVMHQARLSKRGVDGSTLPGNKRIRVDRPGQVQLPMPANPMHASIPSPTTALASNAELTRRPSLQSMQGGSPSLGQVQIRSPSSGQQSNGRISSPRSPAAAQFRDPRLSQTPSQAHNSFGPPAVLSRESVQGPYHTPVENPSTLVNPNIEQQLNPALASWYTLQDCLQKFNSFQASYTVSPDHPRDGRRLAVLRDATERQDWAYLSMHQYYCLLTHNPASVPVALQNQPSLRIALKVFHDVLDGNDSLSPDVRRFFSNYPYPLEELGARWPSAFQYQGHLFLLLVTQSPNCDQLKRICEKRRIPPLPRELAIDLRIASETFQRLIFTAFLRSIWRAVPQNLLQARFEAQAVIAFRQAQTEFQQRDTAARPSTPRGLQKEADQEVWKWSTKLKQLADECWSGMLDAGYTMVNQQLVNPQQMQAPASLQRISMGSNNDLPHAPVITKTLRPARSVDPKPAQVAAVQPSRPQGSPRSRPPVPQASRVPQALQAPQAPRVPQVFPSQIASRQRQRQTSTQQTRPSKPFLPSPGWIQPQQRLSNPSRFGLHQAHLRSPVLQMKSPATPLTPLYHYLHSYKMPPVRLTKAGQAIEKLSFSMSSNEMQSIAEEVSSNIGNPGIRFINEQSQTVRLRCIKWPGKEMPNKHAWAIADTYWVPYSCFTLNGTPLQQRRKVYNGKDLPTDLTSLLVEGENMLEAAVIATSTDTSHLNYLVAVEVLGVLGHDSIKQLCFSQRISAGQVKHMIRQKLSGTSDDDELAIVESNLSITLFDPFSASKICDIPVRSSACLHIDCFDLETFLETRQRKGDISVADQWRCPICNADARPPQLIVDGFLEEVRNTLERQGLLQTRAIVVQQDGSWKPKAEVRDPNGVSEDSSRSTPALPAVPVHMEVIDLSD